MERRLCVRGYVAGLGMEWGTKMHPADRLLLQTVHFLEPADDDDDDLAVKHSLKRKLSQCDTKRIDKRLEDGSAFLENEAAKRKKQLTQMIDTNM